MRNGGGRDELNWYARDVLGSIVRILRRAGFSETSIREEFEAVLDASPQRVERVWEDAEREQCDAAHALTLWHQEPHYVAVKGEPRPLRLRGPAPSFETLVRQVAPEAKVSRLLAYLRGIRAVRRKGGYYVATQRLVQLHGILGPAALRNIRGLAHVLGTYEHNLAPSEGRQAWFERDCENPRFPVSKLDEFAALLHLEGMALLGKFDDFMQRCEAAADPKEPTICLGIGLYRYQEDQDVER